MQMIDKLLTMLIKIEKENQEKVTFNQFILSIKLYLGSNPVTVERYLKLASEFGFIKREFFVDEPEEIIVFNWDKIEGAVKIRINLVCDEIATENFKQFLQPNKNLKTGNSDKEKNKVMKAIIDLGGENKQVHKENVVKASKVEKKKTHEIICSLIEKGEIYEIKKNHVRIVKK